MALIDTTAIYFLDRNALSVIKGHLAGKTIRDAKKLAFLERLRKLNQSGKNISSLLAIIEGENGEEETAAQKEQCVINDTDAMRVFFDLASTDADHLVEKAKEAAQVFTTYTEGDWAARSAYWETAAPLVKGGIAKSKRRAMEDRLAELADTHGLKTQDPIHLLMLAALHGSDSAADTLKLNSSKGSYNPLSDLHVLSRMGAAQAIGGSMGLRINPILVSMDEGLEHVLSHIRIISSNLMPDESVHLVVSVGHALYPHLSFAEYLALMARTGAAVQVEDRVM